MVGSLICGFAPTSKTFIVGRAVAGVGASGVASDGFIIVLTISSEKLTRYLEAYIPAVLLRRRQPSGGVSGLTFLWVL
ncbi:MFS transporter [Penicillium hordei]|uniref:MFS transporter n=1 Tax=Penicillium hordei TaxID=40994 RepID=A0AAD6H6V9_9EURO|nr:MFS transporter [Penicillium hordei]KAJ5616243.1 MFS transporter [Penicillium hordei]